MDKKPLLYSALLHLGVLLMVIIGMPYIPHKQLDTPLVLVEFAPIGALTQSPSHKRSAPSQKKALRKVQPQPEEPASAPKPTPPAPAPAPAAAPVPDPSVMAEKKPEAKPAEIVPPEPAKEAQKPADGKSEQDSKAKTPPAEQKAVVDNSKRKSTKTDKEEPKKKAKKDPFASVLDSVAKLDGVDEAVEDSNEEHGEKSTVTSNLGPKLSISEEDAVRRQLQACWTVPVGAKDLEKLIVELEVHATPDGMVTQAKVLNTSSLEAFRVAAQRAVSAALNPKCNPLKLPRDKYEQWKVFIVRFDPRDML